MKTPSTPSAANGRSALSHRDASAGANADALSADALGVPLCRPYEPPPQPLIGLDDALQDLLAAWLALGDQRPLGALLVGPPGVGKNHLVYEAARCTGKALYLRLGGESLRDDDFAIDFDARLNPVLSPLVSAMVTGGIFFIDEIGEVREAALARLLSVLDERAAIEVPTLGWVTAHPGFRFVAAMNTSDTVRRPLPEKLRQRLWEIHVAAPPREVVRRILLARFPDFYGELDGLLTQFWDSWRARRGDTPPVPRQVLHVFGQALRHAALEAHTNATSDASASGAPRSGAAFPLHAPATVPVRPRHLERAFETLPSTSPAERHG